MLRAMDQNAQKKAAAEAALKYVEDDMMVGVGTGSTVNFFIDALAGDARAHQGRGGELGGEHQAPARAPHPVVELNNTDGCDVYVDGADEVTEHLAMVKGGGGALTREKIVAAASRKFVCIADAGSSSPSSASSAAGGSDPMARSYVGRTLVKLGGMPELRAGFTTDNGNLILDCARPHDPEARGDGVRAEPDRGVVTNGLFARRPADVLLLAGDGGVRTLLRP
jgi:ribose 5-phosphate isomerase A